MHTRKYQTLDQLLRQVVKSFEHIEKMGLRVGDMYLHLNDVRLLETDSTHLDRVEDSRTKSAMPGIVGYLYGARVFESELVPEEHIALIPDGIEGRLVDSAACVPL